jgi:hypothetical protein
VETVTAIALDAQGLGDELGDLAGLVDVDAECDGDFDAECADELVGWLAEVVLEECTEAEVCGLDGGAEVVVPAFALSPPPPAIAPTAHHRMSSTATTTRSATSRRTQ